MAQILPPEAPVSAKAPFDFRAPASQPAPPLPPGERAGVRGLPDIKVKQR